MSFPYFDWPLALWLAPVLAAAVAALMLAAFRRRVLRLAQLGGEEIVSRLVPPAATRTPWWRAGTLGGAALCLGVAIAGPRWGSETAIVRGSGADVVLALDASLSMLATDERPNRLEKMKAETRRLLASSEGDRFGLIAFAGRSYILTPLTVDQGALELFLDNLDPSVVGQAGSSLSRAIRQGTDLLLTSHTEADRALVIMSDGEAFEPAEDVAAAAKRAAESGVIVIAVGFGTTTGSTIPVQSAEGIIQKRDENGDVVVTRYTPGLLRAAASASSGTFIDAGATDKATRVRSALSSLRREHRQAEAGRERRPRFQLFLIPAMLLALLDTLLAERRGRRRRMHAAAATAASLLLMMMALPRAAFAAGGDEGDRLYRAGRYREAVEAYAAAIKGGDESARALYNLGTALIAAGRAEEAVAPLEKAATTTDADLRYRALFNLGLIKLKRGLASKGDAGDGLMTEAAEAYKRALRLKPNERDAKWNYELANRNKQQKSGGGGGGGNNQPQPQQPQPQPSDKPAGGLNQNRAEQILNSAAREERDVQGKKQHGQPPDRPRGGKDW